MVRRSLQIICRMTVLYNGVKKRAANSSVDRGTEPWMKKNWQQILVIRSKRVYTNLYFIYDTLWDSAYIGDHPKYYCLFNRKTIHTPNNMLKKCTDWGRGWEWRREKKIILPLQSNHQNGFEWWYSLKGLLPQSCSWQKSAENTIGHFLFRKRKPKRHSTWLVKWLLKTREDETQAPSF